MPNLKRLKLHGDLRGAVEDNDWLEARDSAQRHVVRRAGKTVSVRISLLLINRLQDAIGLRCASW